MYEIVLIIVGIAIIYQSVKLIKEQRKLKKQMKNMSDDWDRNIEFEGYVGSGISQKRKNYPTLDDDHVPGARIEPHSISNHSNDPSDMQKYAFDKENEK